VWHLYYWKLEGPFPCYHYYYFHHHDDDDDDYYCYYYCYCYYYYYISNYRLLMPDKNANADAAVDAKSPRSSNSNGNSSNNSTTARTTGVDTTTTITGADDKGDREDGNESSQGSAWDSIRAAVSSPTAFFSSDYREMIDAQRVERLRQCRSLQRVLRACRERVPDRPQLEDFPMGIRSVRYFQWRHGNEDSHTRMSSSSSTTSATATAPTTTTTTTTTPSTNSCLREEHAVWACRGVALKCGGELVRLRDCFNEYSAEELLDPKNDATAYESNTTTTTVDKRITPPCASMQQALGTCVTKNAAALAERRQQYKKK